MAHKKLDTVLSDLREYSEKGLDYRKTAQVLSVMEEISELRALVPDFKLAIPNYPGKVQRYISDLAKFDEKTLKLAKDACDAAENELNTIATGIEAYRPLGYQFLEFRRFEHRGKMHLYEDNAFIYYASQKMLNDITSVLTDGDVSVFDYSGFTRHPDSYLHGTLVWVSKSEERHNGHYRIELRMENRQHLTGGLARIVNKLGDMSQYKD